MVFLSRTAFVKNHLGVSCTSKFSVRDAARLKAQSEGTESNCNYRIKRFSFLILISEKPYFYEIAQTEEALCFCCRN